MKHGQIKQMNTANVCLIMILGLDRFSFVTNAIKKSNRRLLTRRADLTIPHLNSYVQPNRGKLDHQIPYLFQSELI